MQASSPPRSPHRAARGRATTGLRRSRPLLVVAAYCFLHLASHLSARFFEVSPGVSLWYPPAGLALALLVLLGPRYAPVVFATNVAGACLTPDFGANWSLVLFPLLITANYTAAAILARRVVGPRLLPGTARETTVFLAGTFLAPVGIALAGTATIALFAPASPEELLRTAAAWWLGDASGLLTVAPVAMVFVGPWLQGEHSGWPAALRQPRRLLLVGAETLALVASLLLVFSVDALPRTQTFYLCILPLVWACLQHGLPGATLATLGITLGGLLGLHLTGTTAESATGFLFLELTVSVVGLGLGSTVSRRNAAEQRLAANEARLNRITIGSQVGLWEHDLSTGQVTYSHLCAGLLRLDPASRETTAARWYDNMHPIDRPRVTRILHEHLEGRTSIFFADFRLPPASGPDRWINTRGSIVSHDAQGRPLLLSGSLVDITERRQAKFAAERQLQIIEATSDLILTIDPDGRLLFANAALLRFCDRPESGPLHDQRIGDLLPRGCCERLRAIAATLPGSPLWTGELEFGNPAGTVVPMSAVALLHRATAPEADRISFVLHDISRQKQAEEARLEQERKLLQLQKTESLGVLAGGIAHDFNNLLMAMLGNAELARSDLPADSALHEPLTQIEIAAHRAADLCQQMLAYAGRRPLVDTEVDLNAVVTQTQRLVQVSISKKIGVHLALAPTPMTVRAATQQLQQIILNLVLNAADAIGDREGRISLRSTSRDFDHAALRAEFGAATLPAGNYVLCEVEDTGHGMPPEIQRRIFEPFFTTKAKGHGLGLAAAHGVVTSHGGAIAVVSAPGRGSTFRFILPKVEKPAARAATAAPSRGDRQAGLVLVVDDEPGVQLVAVRLLENLGFTALAADDGTQAVRLFREHHHRLCLVLLDLMMPHMDGVEAFGEFHRLNPAVPVVLMSGYTGNLNLDRFPAAKPAGLLSKPFTREKLESQIENIFRRN